MGSLTLGSFGIPQEAPVALKEPAERVAEDTLVETFESAPWSELGDGTPTHTRLVPIEKKTRVADRYVVERELGRGNMGTLYEALDLRLDARVALKVMHPWFLVDPSAIERFELEATLTHRVQSNDVVEVLDRVFTEDARPCIVYEYLEGEDLQRRLEHKGVFSMTQALSIAKKLARAVSYVHAAGIVHRDIKPANVFLVRSGHGRTVIKLLDFGVAKVLDRQDYNPDAPIVGTPAYMAPEQAMHSDQADERADIYSIGAVLFRMLTGRAPYRAHRAEEALAQLICEPPPTLRALRAEAPARIEALVAKIMARDPKERPQTALALEKDIKRAELDVSWKGARTAARSSVQSE